MQNIERIVTVTLNPTIDRVIEVPGFHVGGHLSGRCISRVPAGKAVNVSRALRTLGVANTAAGFIGRRTLAWFEEHLGHDRIEAEFTPIDGDSRENITLADPESHTATHVRDTGPTLSSAEINALDDRLAEIARAGTAIVFNGSTAPGLSPERFGTLIERCIAAGAAVAVDTNGPPLVEAAQHALWLLKPNELELSQLMQRELHDDDDIIEAGRQLAERIDIVAVTLGKRGAYCFSGKNAWYCRAEVPDDRIRSTVGCGDAMLAGFLAAVVKAGMSPDNALRQAVAVSAASAMTERPAAFDPEEFRRINDSIRATPVPRRGTGPDR